MDRSQNTLMALKVIFGRIKDIETKIIYKNYLHQHRLTLNEANKDTYKNFIINSRDKNYVN